MVRQMQQLHRLLSFLWPHEIEVKPGSVIHVNSMGITKAYKCSGKPAVYPYASGNCT